MASTYCGLSASSFRYLTRKTSVSAIERGLVSGLLPLVRCQHGQPGVARTLTLLRDRFHWPEMCRDTREHVLSCGCTSRKRPRTQRIAMLLVDFFEPWEVLEVTHLQRCPNTSKAGSEYFLLVVKKVSIFVLAFAYPLPSKEAHGVTRIVLYLCLTLAHSTIWTLSLATRGRPRVRVTPPVPFRS